jgi:oxalate decarboxylase/phosphoglucose isomerase-like protein (cupin superfamily)
MTNLDRTFTSPRTVKSDSRGELWKVLNGAEQYSPANFGEIYMVTVQPGQSRGGHYHPQANEWFTVLRGSARAILTDPATGDERFLDLSAADPTILFVPAGLAHSFTNTGNGGSELWILAYSDQPYDPDDTVLYSPASRLCS